MDLSGLQQQAKKEEEEQELSARIIQLEGQVAGLGCETSSLVAVAATGLSKRGSSFSAYILKNLHLFG